MTFGFDLVLFYFRNACHFASSCVIFDDTHLCLPLQDVTLLLSVSRMPYLLNPVSQMHIMPSWTSIMTMHWFLKRLHPSCQKWRGAKNKSPSLNSPWHTAREEIYPIDQQCRGGGASGDCVIKERKMSSRCATAVHRCVNAQLSGHAFKWKGRKEG